MLRMTVFYVAFALLAAGRLFAQNETAQLNWSVGDRADSLDLRSLGGAIPPLPDTGLAFSKHSSVTGLFSAGVRDRFRPQTGMDRSSASSASDSYARVQPGPQATARYGSGRSRPDQSQELTGPKVELFGGYSYLNFDTNGITNRLNLNGWAASAAFSLNRWFGLEADFSGHYKKDCLDVIGLSCKHLSFMGGPKLSYRKHRITAFAHGLVGGDVGTLSTSGISLSDTKLALAVGGGLDYALTNLISIRFAQADYFFTRHLGAAQNNIRVSAGVVFRFGRGSSVRHP